MLFSRLMKVGFLGLGVMDFPVVGYLAQDGYDICVYNRNQAKVTWRLETFSGRSAPSPKDAAMVFTCVGGDDDVREVTLEKEGHLMQ